MKQIHISFARNIDPAPAGLRLVFAKLQGFTHNKRVLLVGLEYP